MARISDKHENYNTASSCADVYACKLEDIHTGRKPQLLKGKTYIRRTFMP